MTTSLLPLRAMARLSRVPATWLRAQAEAGLIPHLKAGARFLFHPPTVETILRERACQTDRAQHAHEAGRP